MFSTLLKRSLVLPFCCFLLLLNTVDWRSAVCLFYLFFGTVHLIERIFPSLSCFSLHFVLLLFIKPPQITTLHSCFSFSVDGFVCHLLYNIMDPVHSSSGTLLTRSTPLNLFVTSTANSYGIWFKSYLAGLVFFLVFFSLSLNFAIRSWWSKPTVSSRSYFYWLYTGFSIFGYKECNQFDFSIHINYL